MSGSDEAERRKARSIAKLRAHNVPYIDWLPYIETEKETKRRTTEEVGLRILCLALVSIKGGHGVHDLALDGIKHFGLQDEFSPEEKAFIFDPTPTEHTKVQMQWRVEAAHVLLWSVSQVENLSFPKQQSDWDAFWDLFRATRRKAFLQKLELRPQSVILDESDLIYRLHWATRDASLHGRKMPAGLNPDVVMERHHALNWLAAPADDPYSWDDTPTDT